MNIRSKKPHIQSESVPSSSLLYRTLVHISYKFFEKAAFTVFCILISWPVIFSILYYNHYQYWIPLFPVAYADTGVLALILVLLYIAKKIITFPGWIRSTFHNHIWVWIGLIMIIWIIVCSLLSADWTIALNGSDNRSEGLLMYCFYGSLTGCGILIKSEKLRLIILRWFSISSISVCLCIFEQSITGSSDYSIGISGPFLHFNHCGYYLAMTTIACSILILITKKCILNLLYAIIFITNLTALIINNTFGGYLAVFFGCLIIPILLWFTKSAKKGKALLFVPIALFLLVSVIINNLPHSLSFSGNIRSSLTELKNDQEKILTNSDNIDSAGTGRIYLWKLGISYVKESPVYGFGPEGMSPLYAADNMVQNRPANELIYYAGCFGLPGLLLYLSMLITLFAKQWKRRKDLSASVLGISCIVIVYLCSSLFGNSIYYVTPFFFMFLGLCSHASAAQSYSISSTL